MFYDEIIETFNRQALPKFKIMHAPVYVKAQNVAEYYFIDNPQEIFELAKDFPCNTPPWPLFITTWKTPEYSYSKELGKVSAPARPDIGAVVSHQEFDQNMMPFVNSDDVKSFVLVDVFFKHNSITELFGRQCVPIDKRGAPVLVPLKNGEILIPTFVNSEVLRGERKASEALPGVRTEKEIRIVIRHVLDVVLMVINFCHCKNVKKETNYYDKHFIRNRRRKGKSPINKFYTLEIYPRDVSPKQQHDPNSEYFKKRFHICRGHFKHYTEEAPLFGKLVGVFWCPAHKKGSSELGEVKKDYSVRAIPNLRKEE